MRTSWAVPFLVLLAGCAGNAPGPGGPVPGPGDDPWNGTQTQPILHLDETGATQFDALCLLGGGIRVERDGGLVLPGTDHLLVRVEAPATTTGVQVGHVLARDPGYDEVTQGNVTWLPIVRAGSAEFQVPVAPHATESGRDRLWAFYLRMNVSDQTDCYTGAQVQGTLVVDIQAVKGVPGQGTGAP